MRIYTIGLLCFLTVACSDQSQVSTSHGFDLIIKTGPMAVYEKTDSDLKPIKMLESGQGLYLRIPDFPFIKGRPEVHPWIPIITTDSSYAYILLDTNKVVKANGQGFQVAEIIHYQVLNRLTAKQFEQFEAIGQPRQAHQTDSLWLQNFQDAKNFTQALPRLLKAAQEDWQQGSDWRNYFESALPFLYIQEQVNANPFFYQDFRHWLNEASQRNSPICQQYLQLWIQLYPQDSIEHRYSILQIAESDEEKHSLFGSYMHYNCLEQANKLYEQEPQLGPFIYHYRDIILEDVLDFETSYWYTSNRIREELDSLLAQPWSLFDQTTTITLEARRQQFEEAEENEISVDLRSGKF